MKATCSAEIHDTRLQPLPSDREIDRAAQMGAAMGEPGRLRILALLLQSRGCVSELTDEIGDSLSLVSQRLKILTAAKLLDRRREGKHVYYQLADDHVRLLVENLLSHANDHHQSELEE